MSLVWARELEVIVTLSCTRLALRKKRLFSRWTGRWIERFFISIHDRIVICDYVSYGGFLKWGVPNSWMVYNGEFLLNGWFRGTPILRNLHMGCFNHQLKLLSGVLDDSDMMRSRGWQEVVSVVWANIKSHSLAELEVFLQLQHPQRVRDMYQIYIYIYIILYIYIHL